MATKESPTVKEDGLHASGLPGVLALPHERAKVQSSGWHEWLIQHSKFRFDTAKGSFTAFKSSKGYWTAQRRVDGNLRHQYLGESHTLTYETLEETAQILAAPDYWRKHVSGKGRPRDADKELTQKSHINSYETERKVEEPSNEATELRFRLAELEARLREKDGELTEATSKIEVLEKETRELRYHCSDLERENARLEQLEASAGLNQSNPAAILNRLRKERKNSKADLKDVELILELIQATTL
jgi:chromosome segregation ATPase